MKVIRYKVLGKTIVGVPQEDGTYENVEQDLIYGVKTPYSEQNEEIAKKEAYNGEYTIEDDGQPDPTEIPTQLDRIEAQVAYNSIMLGTLMEV